MCLDPSSRNSIGYRVCGVALCLALLCHGAHAESSNSEATARVDPKADPASSRPTDSLLLLDVQINGQPVGKIGEFSRRNGRLFARRSELRELGVRDPWSAQPRPDDLIALSSLAGLASRVDEKTMTLYLTAADDRRVTNVLQINDQPQVSSAVESGTGATLNYDFVNTLVSHQISGNGSLDFRAFSPRGVASSGVLVHTGHGVSSSGAKSLVRLDTTYTYADPATLRRYSAGDFITGGLSWTRPVRIEGLQLRSDFSTRPDLVTFPLPSVRGSAAVPSTVDILANGGSVLSQSVDPGPFQVPQLPVVTGAGTISMTVTNALGQQVTVNQPFYASSALLAPGLQAFSVQAGAVRTNWGTLSNSYGDLAASGTYRKGMSSKYTLEGSAEATRGVVMAGGGAVINVHNLGVVNIDAAASGGSGHSGALVSVGGQRISRKLSFGGSATLASRSYRDIAAISGDPSPRVQLNGNVGLTMGRFGSVGMAYGSIDRSFATGLVVANGLIPQQTEIFTSSYSVQLTRYSITLSQFHDFHQSASSGASIGLTVPFGRRGAMNISEDTSTGNTNLQAQQMATDIGDWGYQAYVSAGGAPHEFAQIQHKSAWGLTFAGVDSSAGQTSLVLESQGALSLVNGGLFPSNTIYDSFAVVDTSGLKDVRVFHENRDVGSTNSKGRLLVADLRSFDVNHLTIAPNDVPLDSTLSVIAKTVRPQDRSGVVVKFPVITSHAALLRLVDETGQPIAVGSAATPRKGGVAVPVGYEGEAYLLDLDLHNAIAVQEPDGQRCTVIFDYRAVPGNIPTIGPLVCRMQR